MSEKTDPSIVRYLNTRQAATYLGYAASTLIYLRRQKRGPRYHRLSSQAVRYDIRDLDAWVAAGGDR